MSKVIYIIAFLGAFVITSIGISLLNSKFNNIFQFDFSPPVEISPDSLFTKNGSQILTENSLPVENNLGIIDENNQPENITDNEILRDSLQTLRNEIEQIRKNNPGDTISTEESNSSQSKNEYETWLKKTSDLFASMEPKKAAKIIQNYSDNIARDIIYTMNKKKAAEILAELSPDIVTRIINVN
jgi:flagellar motility protein MotE (MotC chaperone)